MGICGGYQILGQEVRDPLGVEGDPRTEPGLDLLPVVTTMAGAKTTTQVEARVPDPGGCGMLSAYEIHMGVTEALGEGRPAFEIVSRNGRPLKVADGWVAPDRRGPGAPTSTACSIMTPFAGFFCKSCNRPGRNWTPPHRRRLMKLMKNFKKPNWIAWRTFCGAIWIWPRSRR